MCPLQPVTPQCPEAPQKGPALSGRRPCPRGSTAGPTVGHRRPTTGPKTRVTRGWWRSSTIYLCQLLLLVAPGGEELSAYTVIWVLDWALNTWRYAGWWVDALWMKTVEYENERIVINPSRCFSGWRLDGNRVKVNSCMMNGFSTDEDYRYESVRVFSMVNGFSVDEYYRYRSERVFSILSGCSVDKKYRYESVRVFSMVNGSVDEDCREWEWKGMQVWCVYSLWMKTTEYEREGYALMQVWWVYSLWMKTAEYESERVCRRSDE